MFVIAAGVRQGAQESLACFNWLIDTVLRIVIHEIEQPSTTSSRNRLTDKCVTNTQRTAVKKIKMTLYANVVFGRNDQWRNYGGCTGATFPPAEGTCPPCAPPHSEF